MLTVGVIGAGVWFFTDGFGLNSPPSAEHLANQPDPDRQAVEDYEPSEAEIRDAMRSAWSCFYDPTMNENWHDDIYCTDGVDSHRPILLEGQFVSEAEMIAAGDAYEAQLNANRPVEPSWGDGDKPSWAP